MGTVRLIGDGHGNLTPVLQGVSQGCTVVHLGDLGFEDAWQRAARLPNVFVVAGNHDDYGTAVSNPCYLGDFGSLGERIEGADGVWFVRGAFSIDRKWRIEGVDWWREEELSVDRIHDALDAYVAARPHTVLSHDCPLSVARMLLPGAHASRTGELLQTMLEAHAPERWFFGHWHVRWERQVDATAFRCLAIDEELDIEV